MENFSIHHLENGISYFRNEKCVFEFDLNRKEIGGHDLLDGNNQPRCYNQTKRSIKKALQMVTEQFNESQNMYDIQNIVVSAGVRMRSYCAMD